MPTRDNSFTCFSSLPPELRLRIWEEALSVPSGWTVLCDKTSSKNYYNNNHDSVIATSTTAAAPSPDIIKQKPLFIKAYAGHFHHQPFLAGLSCREARVELERLYGQPVHGPSTTTPSTTTTSSKERVYWINFDKTLVYLGNSDDAELVLDGFKPEEVSRLRHVVMTWHPSFGMARTCQRLAAVCPGLRTMIIQRLATADGGRKKQDCYYQRYYERWMGLVEYTGPEVVDGVYDVRGHALGGFGDGGDGGGGGGGRRPRLHMLPAPRVG